MAVNFKNVAKRIFHINHAIGFFSGIVITWFFHPFFSPGRDDLFSKPFNIRILNTKMEDPGFPVFKIVFRIDLLLKLKEFYANLVTGRKMSNAKTAPVRSENVGTACTSNPENFLLSKPQSNNVYF
jgi:hypothetical protein